MSYIPFDSMPAAPLIPTGAPVGYTAQPVGYTAAPVSYTATPMYQAAPTYQASPPKPWRPTEAVKDAVADTVKAYNVSHRKRIKEMRNSPEQIWVEQWQHMMYYAAMAAHEGFLQSAAKSDFYVGGCMDTFMDCQRRAGASVSFTTGPDGLTQLEGEITIDQYVALAIPDVSDAALAYHQQYAPPGESSAYIEAMYKQHEASIEALKDNAKAYDVDQDGKLSFPEYVTMSFIPQLSAVTSIAGGYPLPVATDGSPVKSDEALAKSATDLISSRLKDGVNAAYETYFKGLRAKIDSRGTIEIVGMSNILERAMNRMNSFGYGAIPSATTPEHDQAFSTAVLEGQGRFMAVLLGLEKLPSHDSDPSKSLENVADLWMALECQMFKKLDLDYSGTLDVNELSKAMEDATSGVTPCYNYGAPPTLDYEAMAKHFIDAFDIDSNGIISLAEWLVARAAFQSAFCTSAFYMQASLPTKPLQPVVDPVATAMSSSIPTVMAQPQDGAFPACYGSAYGPAVPAPQYAKKTKKKRGCFSTCSGAICGLFVAPSAAIGSGIGGVMLFRRAGPRTQGYILGLLTFPLLGAAGCIFSVCGSAFRSSRSLDDFPPGGARKKVKKKRAFF